MRPLPYAPSSMIGAERPSAMQSALRAGGLGLLFLLVYGGTNAWTATLEHVPSLYLGWERNIPLLPWSVVPYWSLDLFFLASFFLVADRGQLRRHAARLATAILGASLLFLVFPLRFDWGRPEMDGLPGLLFDALSLDRPFNQFPSLHVALALLVWPLVRRRTRGILRTGLGVWFLLIGLSTLTTWQHHLIDLVGGLVFGLLVGHAIPLDPEPLDRVGRRHRVLAGRYALGALGLAGVAWVYGSTLLILLWPATSLALVASAYVSGRRGFLKANPRGLPISTWLLFCPWLLAMRLNARLRAAQAGVAAQVACGLWIGPHPCLIELPDEILSHPNASLISLAPEIPQPSNLSGRTNLIPSLDLIPPGGTVLQRGLEAIRAGLERGPVYVHCALGLGRSAHLMTAWLQAQGLDADRARRRVLELRPGARVTAPSASISDVH